MCLSVCLRDKAIQKSFVRHTVGKSQALKIKYAWVEQIVHFVTLSQPRSRKNHTFVKYFYMSLLQCFLLPVLLLLLMPLLQYSNCCRCLTGSAYPRPDHKDQSPRAGNVFLLPGGCHGDFQLGGVLRRGRREEHAADVNPGRVLVGHRYHDDGRLWWHSTCRRVG